MIAIVFLSIRSTNDSVLLNTIGDNIRQRYCSNYEPTLMVIATWVNVSHSKAESNSTFQTLLITNGISSYVKLLYSELESENVKYVKDTCLDIN